MTDFIDIRTLPGTAITDVVRGQGYFPVIAGLGGRECMVVLRGGAGHIGLDGRLDAVHSTDGGATWESPITIADSERDDRNPALGRAADGALILAYHWQGSYDAEGKWAPDSRKADTKIICSRDGGRTWDGDRLLDFTPINGASPFGKIRCDIDGTLYMPIYGGGPALANLTPGVTTGDATSPTYLLCSDDNGATWSNPILVALGLNEADLLILPDGEWLFAARSEKRGEAAIYTCRSGDKGSTWTDLQKVTSSSEHPPDLTLLGSGEILLTFGCRNEPYGVQGLLSRDSGRTWEDRRLLYADDLPGFDIGYPSTLRLDDGRLITVFYSAGTPEQPFNTYEATDAFCRAVCYDEEALLEAFSR
jgi:hypothetical protein